MINANTRVLEDPDRLQALRQCCLLDTEAEAAFERLTRLATRVMGAPVSLVSLVTADRQFFKSAVGLDLKETPLSHSFCQHVVATGEPLVIADARTHPLVKDNLAIPDLNVIGYLGLPLSTSDGHEIGSLCVIHGEPHHWTEDEIDLLRELATSVMMEIELRVKMLLQEQSDERFISDTDLYGKSGGAHPAGRFGVYVVQERIGRGGMCEVFRCQHEVLGVTVAVKRLLAMHADLPNFQTRFQREAKIVSQLKHPHIIRVFDFGIEEDKAYMVMEHINGETLETVIDRQAPLPLKETISIGQDVASALDYAHEQGVIHRDVKPANIMLRRELQDGEKTDSYQATLMDFGIAKMAKDTNRITREGALGTLAYISPEQIENAVSADYRADIYSLGVVLYEMLTGQPPFPSTSAAQLIHSHLSLPVPDPRTLNPDLPHHVAAALERALSKDPLLRFGSASEFIQALTTHSVSAV